jgi:hypothetical protein
MNFREPGISGRRVLFIGSIAQQAQAFLNWCLPGLVCHWLYQCVSPDRERKQALAEPVAHEFLFRRNATSPPAAWGQTITKDNVP